MKKSPTAVKNHQRMSQAELGERLNALQHSPMDSALQSAREEELQAVLHELEVYQIELEMQVRELRESRQALEESHNRYVNLYDFAPVGYITLSKQGLIQEINLTMAGMLGVERQWLFGRSLAAWITAADLPIFRAHLKKCGADGGTVKSTLHVLNRDKQEIPVELVTVCFTEHVTGAILFRTTAMDLTDRRRAEAELDRFFALSSDLLFVFESDGRFARVNPSCETILGYSASELIGRPSFDFIHPDDHKSCQSKLLQVGAEGATTSDFQTRYLKKNGSIIWISWTTITSGGLIYCVGRDVTSQLEEKKKSDDQYNWLKEMIRVLPVPMSLVESKTGTFVSASEPMEVLFSGYPKSVDDFEKSGVFCADENGNRLASANWPRMRAARGEEMNKEAFFWQTSQGTLNILVSSRNIDECYGQPPMAVLVNQDVTQLKQIEQTLNTTVENLQSERELRERFVFTLTHDLRTPLTAASMGAQLMAKDSSCSPLFQKISAQVVKSIDRIDHMVEDLLDANRIRAGERLPLKRSSFDLSQLIKDTVEELSEVHGNRFTIRAEKTVIGSWSKNGMRRVIENLVGNALKYGDPVRSVIVSVRPESANSVVLAVQNFGDAIPEEEQLTLFQQFRRASFAEDGQQRGWGLGLTLVRGIVEFHGGKITVESNAIDGTTFSLTLPWKAPSP